MSRPAEPRFDRYVTKGGIAVERHTLQLPEGDVAEPLIRALDHKLGCFFSSSVEFPGRYSRWDIGFKNPPIMITGRGRGFKVQALNARGKILIRAICGALEADETVEALIADDGLLSGRVREPAERFPEEQRSRQPSLFSVLRRLIDLFASEEEPHLGLYGAFGYDLAFQFERIRQRLTRAADQRDVVLYLPDEILAIDHQRHQAMVYRYDFVVDGYATSDLRATAATIRSASAMAAMRSRPIMCPASIRRSSPPRRSPSPAATCSRSSPARPSARRPPPRRPASSTF